ncbi:hypothetical protein N658DRAFT_215846 [Parathielavia hyrcaniae]|uniref:Uncharacterized protein n=1 Tax=Parathielavia hyrcaniae TaxID=113614 RepID=A0AAN6PVH7_9PEZI|nr:hypothetical protein N658DRAFT_215846 [Parathielavia hyrcaniae]
MAGSRKKRKRERKKGEKERESEKTKVSPSFHFHSLSPFPPSFSPFFHICRLQFPQLALFLFAIPLSNPFRFFQFSRPPTSNDFQQSTLPINHPH